MPTDDTRTGTLTTNTEADMKPKSTWSTKKKILVYGGGGLVAAFTLAAIPLGMEANYSFWQQHLGTNVANNKTGFGYSSKKVNTPPEAKSAIDQTRGYADSVKDDAALARKNYTVSEQVEYWEHKILGTKLYSLDEAKPQAGLQITDDTGKSIYEAKYPRQIFNSFDEIPEIWWKTLLEVENRELLDHQNDGKNVTIEVDRLVKAIVLKKLKEWGAPVENPGGSGLAVQIEKMLHSPDGQSRGDKEEKKRQILTAMAKYYKDHDAKKFVVTYFNIVSLASTKLDGNVDGYAEAMHIWYGRDLELVKKTLTTPDDQLDANGLKLKAQIYIEAASLVIAVKKPDEYYNGPSVRGAHLSKAERAELGRKEMRQRLGKHLPAFVRKGIISQKLFDNIDLNKLEIADPNVRREIAAPSPYKYVNNLRIQVQQEVSVPSLYDLDRRDLSARTTELASLNTAVERICKQITDPVFARASGLIGGPEGRFLFDERDLPYIKCAFIMNERMDDGRNVTRALTDNDASTPMNKVSGGRQGMGSTAKPRWGLYPYEAAMSDLYEEYSKQTPEQLNAALKETNFNDNHTRWALTTLLDPKNSGITFDDFLDLSLERTYSGNPGGTPVENFDRKENGWNSSVRKNLHHSVNAAFWRIMRDNVNFVIYHKMKIDQGMFDDINDPRRIPFLDAHTINEGSVFLGRAMQAQTGMSEAATVDYLVAKSTAKSPEQLAALFRYLYPEKPVGEMKEFILKNVADKYRAKLEGKKPEDAVAAEILPSGKKGKSATPVRKKSHVDPFEALYANFAPGHYDQAERTRLNKKTGEVKTYPEVYDLNERRYKIFGNTLHPLSLWLAKTRIQNPDLSYQQIEKLAEHTDGPSGKSIFRQSYGWLYAPSKKLAQNRALISIIRFKAFNEYLGTQQQLIGYPFKRVVPDERIVLGSNGDTAAALATFMGVIQNDGKLMKPDLFWTINRAEGTVYQKLATKNIEAGKQVIRPEIARSLRRELQGVVQEGTGAKLRETFRVPAYDDNGNAVPGTYTIIPNGGKTGSDDGKLKGRDGSVVGSSGRTATWTFLIGNRLYGTTFLYVEGKPVQEPVSTTTVKGKDGQTTTIPSAAMKSVNPAARAHFTSATAVITTKLLFNTPEFQSFVTQQFAGKPIEGGILMQEKKLPAPKPATPKPVATPRIAANDQQPALAKPEPKAATPD